MTVAGGYSSNLIPSLGTSYAAGTALKRPKKKKRGGAVSQSGCTILHSHKQIISIQLLSILAIVGPSHFSHLEGIYWYLIMTLNLHFPSD